MDLLTTLFIPLYVNWDLFHNFGFYPIKDDCVSKLRFESNT